MLLIKNGKILTMSGVDYNCGYILADGGKIITVTGDYSVIEESLAKSAETTVIDASGRYVLPGLIDAHCHVGMWEDSVGEEGSDGNEMSDPITPHLRAIDGIYHADRAFEEARESGVTTVVTGPGSANIIGGQFAAVKTWGRSIDEMVLKEPAAMKIAFGENPKTVYKGKSQAPMTRMATAAMLRESLMEAREYMEKKERSSRDPEKNSPPDFDLKRELLSKVLTGELQVKAHAHRADDILTAIRIGKEFGLKLSIEHCTEGHLIADILSEEKIPVIVGPLLTDRSKIELRSQTLKNPAILTKAGIKVAIMTDHPEVPIQYLSLCAALAVREGLDETEALRAITINAAEIAGINDRVGSLEAGKDADIAIFDGYPLELRSRIVTTIINGRVVYDREKDR